MTRERLERLRSLKDEIKELKWKLDHLGEGDSLIGNDVIYDYRKGFPKAQSIVGHDYEEESRLKRSYSKKIDKLCMECAEVEQWIESIPDSVTRRIFRMTYVDGMTQQKIAYRVHMDRSRVSRKIENYLKNAQKAKKAHL